MLKGKITFCTCNWVRLPCNSAAFSPSNPRMILILWASRLVCKKINTWSLNVRAQSPIRQRGFLDIKQPHVLLLNPRISFLNSLTQTNNYKTQNCIPTILNTNTHTHIHTHIYIIYMCVYVYIYYICIYIYIL